MQFAFQIILLAVGFGVGYWLIITANNQQGTMKTTGQVLGGILIVMAIFLGILSTYYSMKISNRGYMQGGCPRNRTMNPAESQNNYKNDFADERSELEQDTNTQRINHPLTTEKDITREEKSRPVERDVNDKF